MAAKPRIDGTVHINCYSEDGFLRAWMEILTPFHKLTSREKDVAARILSQYFKMKAGIQDPFVLWEVMWSKNSRKDIMDSLGMSQPHFQLVLGKLRQCGFLLKDDEINPKYIPHRADGASRFMFLFVYDWSTESNPVTDEGKQTDPSDV